MHKTTALFVRSLPATFLLLGSLQAAAQDIPRTASGRPVLQGYFTNNTIVPFERSSEHGDRPMLTAEEAQVRIDEAFAPRGDTEAGTNADVHYETGEFGLNPTQNELVMSRATSIITHPANGRTPPLLADAARRSDERRAIEREHTYDSAQNRPLAERCVLWPHEGPPLRPVGYNTYVQIVQTDDHLVFMSEMIHDARVIPISDTRPDIGNLPRWQGNSWAHWEGDTLVIETTGFRDEVYARGANIPMGPEGKVIEKLTRRDAEHVMYEFNVSDPSLWEGSWGGEYPMKLTEGPMFEYACHEGNYGIANILSGQREEERKAALGQ